MNVDKMLNIYDHDAFKSCWQSVSNRKQSFLEVKNVFGVRVVSGVLKISLFLTKLILLYS